MMMFSVIFSPLSTCSPLTAYLTAEQNVNTSTAFSSRQCCQIQTIFAGSFSEISKQKYQYEKSFLFYFSFV